MSSRKDKFSLKDKEYMRIAMNIAKSRNGLTGDNPSVGCIIVKNDKIISIGVTGYNGRPHAETNAIDNSLDDLAGSKMYVTLEPCNHYGKTPPCTTAIITSGIKKIYYPANDIDSKVRGKSFKILTKKNIIVGKGLLKNEAKKLYESYIINRKKKLPYVTGKIAISKNKLIYSNDIRKITDKVSDKLTHYLRYKNDSILISVKTLNIDNPKLNCRLKGFEKFSPKRIVLDKNLDIKLDTYIFKTVKKNNTFIFYNKLNKSKVDILKKKGVNLIQFNLVNKKHFNLKLVLKKLYKMGCRHLLVEGGDKITKDFLKKRLINKFFLFKSPKKLPKNDKYLNFSSFETLKTKYHNKSCISSKLAKDTITIYKR
jgi:diaminohydroxyphosphoribosylaminopyrimidine deaminase/5-amino-6-(5-phosphoribosylamino)uracil reductase